MQFRSPLSGLWCDRSGVVAIITAVAAPVIFGAAAVAIDVGRLVLLESQLQAAADSAALAAVTSVDDSATAQSLAQEYAGKNMPSSEFGTVIQTADVIIGNYDSDTSTFTANGTPANAVQVTAKLTQANGNAVTNYFGQLIGIETSDIETSALAVEQTGGGDFCVLALDSSARGAITVSGTTGITQNSFGFAVASDDASALRVTGNGTITVSEICVAGGSSLNNNTTVTPTPTDDCDSVPSDPLSGLTEPTTGSCLENNFKVTGNGNSVTLSPGTYCGGIDLGSGNTITMTSGEYILNGGGFKFGGGTLTGSEVLIFNTGTSPSDKITITGGTSTLSAPTSGTYAGVLFFMDPDLNSNVDFSVSGNAETNFTGAIYSPSHDVDYSGSSSVTNACTQIIAKTVSFSGSSRSISPDNCSSSAIDISSSSGFRLRG